MYKALFLLHLIFTTALLNVAHADNIKEALESYRNGQVADAISLLEPLAQQGHTKAESALGAIYYNEGGPNADRKAYELFLRAARKNDVEAQYNLANMYLYINELPEQVENQDQEAARWFFEAGNQGHADAQYTLGLLILAGTGVARNPEEAYRWINLAAEQGHAEAQQFIGTYK